MTYEDFLKRFAAVLGISRFQSRAALEMFAVLLNQKFGLGIKTEINSLGFFVIKKIVYKSLADTIESHDAKVLLFSENKSFSEYNCLKFFLPESSNPEKSELDDYLNLSIGKPLLNPKSLKDFEFVSDISNRQNFALLESKVEKLISEAIQSSEEDIEREYIVDEKLQTEEAEFSIRESEEQTELLHVSDMTTLDKKENGDEEINSVNSFNLVEPDNLEMVVDEQEGDKKASLAFNDDALKNQIKLHETELISFNENKNNSEAVSNSKIAVDGINEDIEKHKSKFSKKIIFVFFSVIFISAIIFFVYLNLEKITGYYSELIDKKSNQAQLKSKIQPNIIERNSSDELSQNSVAGIYPSTILDSEIISPSVFLVTQDSISNRGSSEQGNEKMIYLSNKLEKVGGNIYKSGEEYYVQVSSFRFKKTAEKEAEKLINKGFKVNISESNYAEIGKVYRILIGGFNSLTEANEFVIKNK